MSHLTFNKLHKRIFSLAKLAQMNILFFRIYLLNPHIHNKLFIKLWLNQAISWGLRNCAKVGRSHRVGVKMLKNLLFVALPASKRNLAPVQSNLCNTFLLVFNIIANMICIHNQNLSAIGQFFIFSQTS